MDTEETGVLVTRRAVLGTSAGTAAVVASGFSHPAAAADQPAAEPLPQTVDIELRVNGISHALTLDPRVSLLDALREHLALTGSKKGCDHGQCCWTAGASMPA
jgi:xanthine dehydrogenase YagT iron-sulfur-binding subunit